jgi:hypothetical protein
LERLPLQNHEPQMPHGVRGCYDDYFGPANDVAPTSAIADPKLHDDIDGDAALLSTLM